MSRSYPLFLLFGDSLIEFSDVHFAGPLQQRLSRRLDVLNRGLSGYNSSQALQILPKIIPDPSVARIAYVLLLFGANDACIEDSPTRQQVLLEVYKKNIKMLIEHPLVKAHDPRVVLVTPPPIEETLCEGVDASKGIPLCRRAARTRLFAQAVADFSEFQSDKLLVLNLWESFMALTIQNTAGYQPQYVGPILGSKELGLNAFLRSIVPDGLHLNEKGYTIFLNTLLEKMKQKWPADGPMEMPYVFPEWRTLSRHQAYGSD